VTDWAAIVGPENVASGGPDDAVDGIVPEWIVRPGRVAEVQACVRAAAGAGRALVARGLGAHLGLGVPPARVDVIVSLDRLARVLDHQAADMTVTVEAGCPLAELGTVLDASRQWLPVDPADAERTTIGGLVAANRYGPLRASQGGVRDLLIGIRTVGADGAVISGGGRVVKNVAGYDLPKLHVGALGTLGVIVEATFKVRPRPDREEAVVVACRSAAVAGEIALLASDVSPLWLELAGRGGLAEGPGDGAAVVVGVAGIVEEVADARARLIALARRRGLGAVAVEDGAGLRARLAAFPADLRAAMLPSDVGAFVERASHEGLRCLAHAANGVVRLAAEPGASLPRLVSLLRPELEARGGSLVVERATPSVKAAVDVWGDPGPGLGLMRGVKQALDPGGTFAPGRFVGGL
jgi:glycolate dehydrogenase FAD-binding subunit